MNNGLVRLSNPTLMCACQCSVDRSIWTRTHRSQQFEQNIDNFGWHKSGHTHTHTTVEQSMLRYGESYIPCCIYIEDTNTWKRTHMTGVNMSCNHDRTHMVSGCQLNADCQSDWLIHSHTRQITLSSNSPWCMVEWRNPGDNNQTLAKVEWRLAPLPHSNCRQIDRPTTTCFVSFTNDTVVEILSTISIFHLSERPLLALSLVVDEMKISNYTQLFTSSL